MASQKDILRFRRAMAQYQRTKAAAAPAPPIATKRIPQAPAMAVPRPIPAPPQRPATRCHNQVCDTCGHGTTMYAQPQCNCHHQHWPQSDYSIYLDSSNPLYRYRPGAFVNDTYYVVSVPQPNYYYQMPPGFPYPGPGSLCGYPPRPPALCYDGARALPPDFVENRWSRPYLQPSVCSVPW